MSLTVKVCRDSEELAVRAADFVVRSALDAIRERGRYMLALAGGSTPKAAYRLLARLPFEEAVDWAHTYLFFGDERFVPPEDPRSNFAMARHSLLEPAGVPPGHAFPVPTLMESAATAAKAYEATLREVFGKEDRQDPPQFDLILLGLGADGHTASLFPAAPALSVTDRWVVATPPGSLPPDVERVTLTYPVLNAARDILFLVSGPDKAEAVRDVLEGHFSRDRLPAAAIAPASGNVAWLIDGSAAKMLRAGTHDR